MIHDHISIINTGNHVKQSIYIQKPCQMIILFPTHQKKTDLPLRISKPQIS